MHAVRTNRIWIKKQTVKRLFVAIPLDAHWTSALARFQQDAAMRNVTGTVPTRWTRPENFHITVRFIGSLDVAYIPGLIGALRGFVAGQEPFTMPFARFEVATPDDPKMIWARFASTRAFADMVNACTARVSDFLRTECNGMVLHNGHDVIPHVTLARLSGRAQATDLDAGISGPNALTVDTLLLHESKTLPQGSVYKKIAAFRLGR